MGAPIKANLELFYGADKDIVLAIRKDNDPNQPTDVSAMDAQLKIANMFDTPVISLTGVPGAETNLVVFQFIATTFADNLTHLQVGQYKYGVWMTETGRTFLSTYGRLTVLQPPV